MTVQVLEKPKTLLVTPFSSGTFTPSKARGLTTFVTEASALEDRHLEQLYEDSREVGLAIRFDSTGEVAAYKLVKANPNSDYASGTDKWEYAPTEHSMETVPECKKTRVIVFND